jgi:hypothetical protein
MKPLQHAKASASRHGGVWRDYLSVHNVFDCSKAAFATTQHRALLHNELGIEITVLKNGETLINSDGATVAVRELATEHLLEDIGFTPRLDQWLAAVELEKLPKIRRNPPQIACFQEEPLAACRQRWGGDQATWAPVLAFFDLPTTLSDAPRAGWFLWNSLGIWLAEDVLGCANTTPEGRDIAVRAVGEILVPSRMRGFIPAPFELFAGIRLQPWMTGEHVAAGIRNHRAA